jgi:Peptidase family M28
MTPRTALLVATQAVVVALAASYGTVRYLTSGPDSSFESSQLSFSPAEAYLATQLNKHVTILGAKERNVAHPVELEQAAAHIEEVLKTYGHAVTHHTFVVDGVPVRNIEAVIEAKGWDKDKDRDKDNPETIVIGAHYDSAPGTPGADSNGTGAAAVLELSRHLLDLQGTSPRRIRLVFFVNAELPYFQSADMGSLRYARELVARRERVVAMYSLDSLGYYSNERGSQRHAPLLGLVLTDRGDFVAFVGRLGARALVREAHRAFRGYTAFPSFSGVGLSAIPGIDWSDNWAFAEQGFPAVLVTDTGALRNPHYHKPTDTPATVDIPKLTRVVRGIEGIIRNAVR